MTKYHLLLNFTGYGDKHILEHYTLEADNDEELEEKIGEYDHNMAQPVLLEEAGWEELKEIVRKDDNDTGV